MPLQATSGAASYDAFGGGVAVVPTYIEDLFSCFLYTGTGASQTITNNIDLSTKGGMVWIKSRSNATSNVIFDTVRGIYKFVATDTTNSQDNINDTLTAFNTTGFSLGSDALDGKVNTSPRTYASWTFRKQPKFFTQGTYTGNGTTQNIAHDLASTAGVVLVKRTDTTGGWIFMHREGFSSSWGFRRLDNTSAFLNCTDYPTYYGNNTSFVAPTSTVFTIGSNADVNASGGTYVYYLFAHNAGGFGLTGTDNVISCGSFTTDGSGNATVSLGYEPQWLMFKASTTTQDWYILDSMRGMTSGGIEQTLRPNTSGAEDNFWNASFKPTATGFSVNAFNTSTTYIYIAIRRGPMKVPTTGTSVFAPVARTGTGSIVNVTTPNFAPDLLFSRDRGSSAAKFSFNDKLRGPTLSIYSTDTAAEVTTTGLTSFNNLGYTAPADGLSYNEDGDTMITECFQRAPSFMDVVCYTGTGSARTVSHNLAAVPELMIIKSRSRSPSNWPVYSVSTGNTKELFLNTTAAAVANDSWNNTTPTSSVFSTDGGPSVNDSGATYVAYLFATCAGVSKVGSYTGTATTKQIDCGFTAGARFVLIKRTDSTGDWYVWDTARGIVSGNDSYLLLNSTAAEVTSTDYIDTYSAGFEISSTAPAAINASGGTYIFLAIA
jgi:hypothetical protein